MQAMRRLARADGGCGSRVFREGGEIQYYIPGGKEKRQ